MAVVKPADAKVPTGTVTYILADIEGSVRLWEGQTAQMGDALSRLDEVVTETVEKHHGFKPIEQGEGDSFLAVFTRASDAVECALEIQQRIRAEPWPGEQPLKVRMALHTGEAQLRGGIHYVGRAINRCARIRGMAWGGQVVLSQSTYELVLDRLPEGASLKHLGSHRLRDLERPERTWQLIHSDIPTEFPPLRSLDTLPNNLPLQLTSFVGRENEIAQVTSLLDSARLVTITGAGGCGKTRLALQVAAELLEEYPDGVWLVDLAPISDPDLVIHAVASTLSVPQEQFVGILESIVRAIGARKILVILDNCEHVVASTASLAEKLLRRNPALKVLATSREPLGIPGEN
ncbi:MAG: ATP-binding protein, partial [Acidimicrobiia bacterium]